VSSPPVMASQRKPEEQPPHFPGKDVAASLSGSLQAAGAPLNAGAASGLANLVSTAVPSITKAFAAWRPSPTMVTGERKGSTRCSGEGVADGTFKSARGDWGIQGAKEGEHER